MREGCPLGKAYPTKREAQEASPGMQVKRCGRCRGWHAEKRNRQRRKQSRR
jgi:hypothetical protein